MHTGSMARISITLGDDELAQIDAEAGGNRSSFMVKAAVDRARALRRKRVDEEIATALEANIEEHAEVYADWEVTIADGLD